MKCKECVYHEEEIMCYRGCTVSGRCNEAIEGRTRPPFKSDKTCVWNCTWCRENRKKEEVDDNSKD